MSTPLLMSQWWPRRENHRRNALRDVQGEAKMYAEGTKFLEHVHCGYRKFQKCAPRVQETTTMTTTTTTKSLHNSFRETLSKYLVNGIKHVLWRYIFLLECSLQIHLMEIVVITLSKMHLFDQSFKILFLFFYFFYIYTSLFCHQLQNLHSKLRVVS
jgi:hypothetical protein